MAHGTIDFEHGWLTPEQLVAAFSAMRADVTFVDAAGIVRYYSVYRIFDRTPESLDRGVVECHSPGTRAAVEQMLSEFATGFRDEALFLEHKEGRPVSTRYIAVRRGDGGYLGCLEVAEWADEVGA